MISITKCIITSIIKILFKKNEMNYKGGIIIIGSLLWDNSTIRTNWRKKYFNQKRIKIKLPIRYGRNSISRMDTYTMVYSPKLNIDEYGQGIVLEFSDPITALDDLKEISENTIRVERNKTKDEWIFLKKGEPFTLNWNWGVLGICINPKHKDGELYSEIISPLLDFWKGSLANFCPDKFSTKDEPRMINEHGLFEIDWNDQIESFDFLISTIVKPNTDTKSGEYPDENLIAKKMYISNYYSYFIKNIENSIYTKDDDKILELLKKEYSVLNYIEKLAEIKSDIASKSNK